MGKLQHDDKLWRCDLLSKTNILLVWYAFVIVIWNWAMFNRNLGKLNILSLHFFLYISSEIPEWRFLRLKIIIALLSVLIKCAFCWPKDKWIEEIFISFIIFNCCSIAWSLWVHKKKLENVKFRMNIYHLLQIKPFLTCVMRPLGYLVFVL